MLGFSFRADAASITWLGPSQGAILSVLLAVYPESITQLSVSSHINYEKRSLGASALFRMPPSLHGLKQGPPDASYVPRQGVTPGPLTILWVGTPMPSYSRHWYNNDVIHWTSCKARVCGWEGD